MKRTFQLTFLAVLIIVVIGSMTQAAPTLIQNVKALLKTNNSWTGTNTFNQTISGSIDGNAATANHATAADDADRATTAEIAVAAITATNAGHATTADSATSAGTASVSLNANHATTADSSTNASYAATSGTAEVATTATNATHATTADSATSALTATTAEVSTTATTAGHASTADSATNATNATNATSALTATTAEVSTSTTVMSGATAGAAGTQGAVPKPSAGDQDKFLRGDASWIEVPPVKEFNAVLYVDQTTTVPALEQTGSVEQPFSTIQAAIDKYGPATSAADYQRTVLVDVVGGYNYTENLTIPHRAIFIRGAGIKITGNITRLVADEEEFGVSSSVWRACFGLYGMNFGGTGTHPQNIAGIQVTGNYQVSVKPGKTGNTTHEMEWRGVTLAGTFTVDAGVGQCTTVFNTVRLRNTITTGSLIYMTRAENTEFGDSSSATPGTYTLNLGLIEEIRNCQFQNNVVFSNAGSIQWINVRFRSGMTFTASTVMTLYMDGTSAEQWYSNVTPAGSAITISLLDSARSSKTSVGSFNGILSASETDVQKALDKIDDAYQNSITASGGKLQLSGDSTSPGNNKVYGTDGAGIRGWFNAGGSDAFTVKASSGDLTPGYLDEKSTKSVVILSDKLQLDGDLANPGINKMYSTDGSGSRGWYDVPETGEANTASNLGDGTPIFGSKVGVDLRFRSLKASGGLSWSYDTVSAEITAGSNIAKYDDPTPTFTNPVSADITGNASTADISDTASVALNANYATSASSAATAGFADTASVSLTSGYAATAGSASTAGHASTSDTASVAINANYAATAGSAASAEMADTASVALTANFATSAGNATNADHALIADTASIALNSNHATTADSANYATSAGTADTASVAINSNYANTAGSAGTALNADTASVALAAPWSGISEKPTVLSGYGITDAVAIDPIDGILGPYKVGKIAFNMTQQLIDGNGHRLFSWIDAHEDLAYIDISRGTDSVGFQVSAGGVGDLWISSKFNAHKVYLNGLNAGSAFGGDSGSGGETGLVPAPAAGDAAAGKYLKADGTWTAPTGGTGNIARVYANTDGAYSDGPNISLKQGSNVTITRTGDTFEIAASGGSAPTPWTDGGSFTRTDDDTFSVADNVGNVTIYQAGRPIRYKATGGSYVYGMVRAVTDAGATLTVDLCGAPMTTSYDDVVEYSDFFRVKQLNFTIAGTFANAASTALIKKDIGGKVKWDLGKSYIVKISVAVKTLDSGANQDRVNITVAGSAVATTNTNAGLAASSADTFVDTTTDINISNYDISYGEAIEISTDANGSNGDASDLSVQAIFVMN